MTQISEELLRHKLPPILRQTLGADVAFYDATLLGGGAVQQNWRIRVGPCGFAGVDDMPASAWRNVQEVVLRTGADKAIAASRSCIDEYRILSAAAQCEITVAKPLTLIEDAKIIGRPFFLMQAVAGTALGQKIVRHSWSMADRRRIGFWLGRELARIHAIPKAVALDAVIGMPPPDPINALVAAYRDTLDQMEEPSLTIELGLRWLELNRPVDTSVAFCHRDYRTGNYLVAEKKVTAILDWEFAGWSDPAEDLGWFCCAAWRFGAKEFEAGGICDRQTFFDGYESLSGWRPDLRRHCFWEVAACIRWALIAHQQHARFLAGERSLELALIGRRLPKIEHDIFRAIDAYTGIAA